MRGERRLVSLRRRVAAGRQPAYDPLWAELRRRSTDLGAHAWRFVSPADPELFLEFLEFEAGSDPRAEPPVRSLLDRLDAEIGAAEAEAWREA